MATPRIEAHAFRIWQFAAPLEWNVTIGEISEKLDIPVVSIRYVIDIKRWAGRIGKSRRVSDINARTMLVHHHSVGHSVDVNRLELTELFHDR